MKKTIMALAAACLMLTTQAFAKSETSVSIDVILEESREESFAKVNDVDAIYQDCLKLSDLLTDPLGEKIKAEYENNCASLAYVQQSIEDTKQSVIQKITEEDFNSLFLVASNETTYFSNLNLISSLLIESPMEKRDIIKYLNGQSSNDSPDVVRENLESLDVKYKAFKIDKVLFQNLKKSYEVLDRDKERVLNIQLQYNHKIKELALERIKESPESTEYANLLIQSLDDAEVEFNNFYKPAIDLRLSNLKKYLKDQESANLVYSVFNRKNPLLLETLPTYTKRECEVLSDWRLGSLAKEKFQVNKIPGCE